MISVILPVYNEERYIENCIKSLIKQTYPMSDMEWIFVDGCSTDNTRSIIGRYAEKYPITLLVNRNRITPTSLNIGIKASKGEYIVRMDAHAAFPPNYISDCIKCLEKSGADNVGGCVETKANGFIGSAIAKMLSSRFGVGGSSFRVGDKEGYVDTVPFGVFRKEIFEQIGLFNEELLRSEDNDINARIIANGGKVYLSKDIQSTYYCRDSISGILRQGIQNGNILFKTIKINPKAMSIRHYIPFAFLVSIIVLPIIGVFWKLIRKIFIFELICYLFLDLWYSFAKPEPKYGFITCWLFPIFHICYGLGSLIGFFGVDLTTK